MNTRQQLYKKNLLLGMSKRAAALAAGYSRATAHNATKNIEKRCDIAIELEIAGLTDKALATHAAQGLEATKKVSIYIENSQGESSHEVEEVADWQSRHKYFETALKLRGKLKQDSLVDNSTHTHFTVILDGKQTSDPNANGKAESRFSAVN